MKISETERLRGQLAAARKALESIKELDQRDYIDCENPRCYYSEEIEKIVTHALRDDAGRNEGKVLQAAGYGRRKCMEKCNGECTVLEWKECCDSIVSLWDAEIV